MEKESPKKERIKTVRAWTLVCQLGLIILVSTAIGLGVGLWIDDTFSFKYKPATIILTLWGIISGFWQSLRLVLHELGKNDTDSIAGFYERMQKEKHNQDNEVLSDDEDEDEFC